jgi:hypothetical protein
MRMARSVALLASLALASIAAAHTDGGCDSFTWDLSREKAAMKASPTTAFVITGLGQVTGLLEPGRRYDATLVPQDQMKFPVPPARSRGGPDAKAGLLLFRSGKAGRYRIALTSRHWIDVLHQGKAVESVAHQDGSGCEWVHKVVEFELPANLMLVLQLSGASDEKVGLVITAPA